MNCARLLVSLGLVLVLGSCGIKRDLVLPENDKHTHKSSLQQEQVDKKVPQRPSENPPVQ